MMNDDLALVRDYAAQNSEEAFFTAAMAGQAQPKWRMQETCNFPPVRSVILVARTRCMTYTERQKYK
jgi:hypothetical protein